MDDRATTAGPTEAEGPCAEQAGNGETEPDAGAW